MGIIGLGTMGITHAVIANSLPCSSVAAFCDSNAMLCRFGKSVIPQLLFFEDAKEMYDNVMLDVIFVTTPPHTHLEIVRQALEANSQMGIFIEKPLASTLDMAYEISRLIHCSKGKATVGFQKRFIGTFRKAREYLIGGAIGKPLFYNSMNYTADIFKTLGGWKFSRDKGGVALDFSPHLVDLLLWYFGMPKSVASVRKSIYSKEVEDYFHAVFTYDNDLVGTADVCWSMRNYKPNELRIEVQGSDGYLIASQDKLVIKAERDVPHLIGKGVHMFTTPALTPDIPFLFSLPEFVLEDQAFLNSVHTDHSPEVTVEEAVEVNKVINVIQSTPLISGVEF